jgi:hypothetical protein
MTVESGKPLHVLEELETVRALGVADLAAARYDVQQATEAAAAPGARLAVHKNLCRRSSLTSAKTSSLARR